MGSFEYMKFASEEIRILINCAHSLTSCANRSTDFLWGPY